MRRRYRLTIDIDVEMDDVLAQPISREGWPAHAPGEAIVQERAMVRAFYQRLMDAPEVLDAYLRQVVVSDFVEGSGELDQLYHHLGVSPDVESVVAPVVDSLEGNAGELLRRCRDIGRLSEALDRFWAAARSSVAGVCLRSLDTDRRKHA